MQTSTTRQRVCRQFALVCVTINHRAVPFPVCPDASHPNPEETPPVSSHPYPTTILPYHRVYGHVNHRIPRRSTDV